MTNGYGKHVVEPPQTPHEPPTDTQPRKPSTQLDTPSTDPPPREQLPRDFPPAEPETEE